MVRMSRPAVLTVVSLVLALVVVALGILLLMTPDGSAFGPGLVAVIIAVLPPTIVRVAFRGSPSLRALRILTIVEFALGVVGAALGIISGAVVASYLGIAAGVSVFAAGVAAAGVGAIVYRTVERGASAT